MRETKYGPKMKVVTTVKKAAAPQSNSIQSSHPGRGMGPLVVVNLLDCPAARQS